MAKPFSIPKGDRFEKIKNNPYETFLNPNYNFIKPNAPMAVIKEETTRNPKLVAKDINETLEQLKRVENYLKMPLDIDKIRQPHVPVHK